MTSDEFRRRMAQLPEPITDKQPPYWEFWRHQLWQLGQTDDPANFINWPCVYHTMLVEHWKEPVLYEFSIVYDSLPIKVLEFSRPEYNNLVHQAYHLYQWQQATGRKVSQLSTIVEFGGGYGAMALLCHHLGFKGRYVIYDLPEFSLLQEWYLSQFNRLANIEWNPKRKPQDVDLFMALYSLSEVKPELRDGLMVKAESYLFLYSGRWEVFDNVQWVQEGLPLLGHCGNWKHTELTHLPDRNNWYSIGW